MTTALKVLEMLEITNDTPAQEVYARLSEFASDDEIAQIMPEVLPEAYWNQ